MSLEDLVMILTKERDIDELQEIGDSFYEDAAAYIKKLEEERKAALKYQEMDMLTDELKNARIVGILIRHENAWKSLAGNHFQGPV